MSPGSFRSASWYLATTLSERLTALRAAVCPADAPLDLARARSVLQRWRLQPPFGAGDSFAQRLAPDGLTEVELLHLLAEPAEAVAARISVPAWLAELEQAFADLDSWGPAALPEEWQGADNIGFVDLIAPLLARGRQRVRDGVRAMAATAPGLLGNPAAVEVLLLGQLPGRLRRMLVRTLVLELNVARLRGQLAGDTPEGRFDSFIQRLRRRDSALALLREYPVLARQVVLCIDRWAACSLEFLGHLLTDRDAIRGLLPDGDPGPLVAVTDNAGDAHRGGRAVRIARFASGAQVVYKPKALAVDQHFQELLAWVNERNDASPPFRTLKVLDRGRYGWVEHVEAHGCATEGEVRRFYQRQGGYLAILYALEATDFHSENLIAAGEHPVLLDLEALFHPRTHRHDGGRPDEAIARASLSSVLRVGLLPQRLWSGDGSAGVDISGLGATGGQLTPFRVPLLEAVGTDSMHLVRKRLEILPEQNRPTLSGADVAPADHAADLVHGFETVYRLFLEHRDELLAPDGLLAAFASDEVRVIFRATNAYSVLLAESYHPDALRDGLDRDRLLDRLWVGVVGNPALARVIPAERADLLQGDIPLFTTRPDSRDLWTSGGDRLPDFFPESGGELVRGRLGEFGPHDLARQRWTIRASMATTMPRGATPSYAVTEPRAPADRAALLAAARAVGDRLDALAVRGGGGATWLRLEPGQGRGEVEVLGLDLYDGLPGVALFLASLGHVTGERRYAALAEAATATLLHQAEKHRSPGMTIGGFDGWGGLAYALAHLATLWDRPALLAEADKIVARLPDLIDRDENLDVISGAAGCVGGLLSLHQVAPSGPTLAALLRCGEHLLARARPMANGLAWPSRASSEVPLTGFSHGTAGVACALLELAAVTGDERYRAAAREALTYERSLFSPGPGNWLDLRTDDDAPPPAPGDPTLPRFSLGWCHGAPGIGLARLRALRHLDDPLLPAEIDAALRTTLAQGFGGSHILCHGDLGNLELLAEAGRTLGDARWRRETNRLAAVILESIRRDGWLCAAPLMVEVPGLMTGLAGIGLGLLRLADPQQVPSVLLLAPPC